MAVFHGPNVHLRALEESDLPFVAQILRDDDTRTHFVGVPPLSTQQIEEDFKSAMRNRYAYWLAIEVWDPHAFVGFAAVYNIDWINGNGECPICLSETWRKQGIGLEVRLLLVKVAFDYLRLNSITSKCSETNIAMTRVNERAGFQLQGRLTQRIFQQGAYHDQLIYGLTREQWCTFSQNKQEHPL